MIYLVFYVLRDVLGTKFQIIYTSILNFWYSRNENMLLSKSSNKKPMTIVELGNWVLDISYDVYI